MLHARPRSRQLAPQHGAATLGHADHATGSCATASATTPRTPGAACPQQGKTNAGNGFTHVPAARGHPASTRRKPLFARAVGARAPRRTVPPDADAAARWSHGPGRAAARRGRRRPCWCWPPPARCWRCASSPARTPTRSSARRRPATRPRSDLHRRFGDDADLRRRARAGRARRPDRRTSAACSASRAASPATSRRAARRAAAGRPVRAAGRHEAGEGRLRAGDVPQHRRRPDRRTSSRAASATQQRAGRARAAQGRDRLARGARLERRAPRRPTPSRPGSSSTAKFCTRRPGARASATASRSAAEPQRPELRRARSSSTTAAPGTSRRRASPRSFPGKDGALVQVRLRDGLSDGQRATAIATSAPATRMPRLAALGQGDYAVTGAPVVVERALATRSRARS